ncbi:hypothetical protein F0L74_07015 [Chitinophaga agrisoli]|uniref:FAD-binding FR-type domain-containing protein n=1 Tax=Chitinophaga agrisoli TaxID=2607653 RepID=A0A5B2W5P2_9BACT|nr:SIP domain-containing protein [Chitinophaga agrisoli]KAA2245697.1 hypothetical protein F0L74_07015 [Chitinophaga agrisoli]
MGNTIQVIKQKTIARIAQRRSKTASVLAVRTWEPEGMIEVDVHLPDTDMSRWTNAQHIDIAVAEGVYRDYTPFGWDAGTATCTLLIETGHNGAGTRWAQKLQPGDSFSYLGVGATSHRPAAGAPLVFLGDESSIAHFLALRQLAAQSQSISGAIAFTHASHRELFHTCCYELQNICPVSKTGSNGTAALLEWAAAQSFNSDTVFYLAGQVQAVLRLRQWLKAKGYSGSGQVKAQGFWK